jgi:serine/threonine protein kinase
MRDELRRRRRLRVHMFGEWHKVREFVELLLSPNLPGSPDAAVREPNRQHQSDPRDVSVTIGSERSSPRSMPFPPGSVVAGKYRVERLLGEGGMGWVVQAMHLQLDQHVALKFMNASVASASPEAVARFLREARAAARIQSEHVARVSDVGTLDTGAPYLVMEYLEGQDLDSLLRTRHALPVSEAIVYALQACEGLAEAHAAGIIHRDLKPANLFLARKPDGSLRVKLLDFGISKLAPAAGRTSDGASTGTQNLMGSPLYMAPEQMRSSKNVDRRADIWSMGVILYEMLTGQSPFNGDTLPEICARILAEPPAPLPRVVPGAIPRDLEAVVFRCLEKDTERRFPDVASLARALASFGPPELAATAERIARLLRVGPPSLADFTPAPSGPVPVAASSFVAQTNASFGTADSPARIRRSSAAAIGVTAAIAIAVVLIGGFVATRGRHSDAPAVSAAAIVAPSAPPQPAPPVVLAPSATPAVTLLPTPAVTPLPASAITPARASNAAATPGTHSPTVPAAHSVPKPKTAPTIAKPSATTGFGGRD